jgi:hypothetical protein
MGQVCRRRLILAASSPVKILSLLLCMCIGYRPVGLVKCRENATMIDFQFDSIIL